MRPALSLSLFALIAACDSPPARDTKAEGPSIVGSSPALGEEGYPRNGPFFVDVDRRLLPRSVSRASVRIESGSIGYFLAVRFDPVDLRIVLTGFGAEPLDPNVQYHLVVEGVRDLDDLPLAEPYEVVFKTGPSSGPPYVPELASYEDVAPIFAARCAGGTCHGADAAVLGLDLSSPEAIRATAIGRASIQAHAGTVSVEGAGAAFGLSALPLVDVVAGVGRPASSYLLYKVLGDEHIIGEIMPPGAPLDDAEIRTIAAWILAGAPTE